MPDALPDPGAARDPDPATVAEDLRRLVGRLVRRARRGDELAPRLATALGYLERDGPMTTSALADRARVRHQSMSATVAALEAQGWVRRDPAPQDRRSMLVSATDEGRARLALERERRAAWLEHAITTELAPDEQRQLAGVLPLLARLADAAPDTEPGAS